MQSAAESKAGYRARAMFFLVLGGGERSKSMRHLKLPLHLSSECCSCTEASEFPKLAWSIK